MPAASAIALIVLALSIIVLSLVERLLHAIFCTVWYIVFGFKDRDAPYTVAAMQLMSSSSSILFRIVSTILGAILQSLGGIVYWSAFFAALLAVTGFVYLAYEQYPLIGRGLGVQWNSFLGPQLHAVIVIPLDLLTKLLSILLPIYNTFAWIVSGIATSSVLPALLKSPTKILQALTATSLVAKTFAESLADYAGNTFRDCDALEYANFQGGGLASCIGNVGTRTLDLITPMSHVRDVVAVVISWVAADVCSPLGIVLDIAAYPIMDLNFAKSIHNLANALLWTVLQIPVVTSARCRIFKETDGIIMCVPDFEPSMQFFMEGLRKFGSTVDNWLDMVWLVVEGIFVPVTTCQQQPLSALSFENAEEKEIQQLLFGSNFTTVVGLTETLFAMTDGVSTIYYSTGSGAQQSEISQDAWPIPVDTRMGIAAVRYGEESLTTAMMGCRCDDIMPKVSVPTDASTTSTFMSISCAIVEYGTLTAASDVPDPSGIVNNHTMPVIFQVDTTRNYMKCAQVKISLESIRWPRRRFTSAGAGSTSALLSMLKGSDDAQNMLYPSYLADAALWVQPFCGADDRPSEACLETFAKAACFPFCMALRQSGSYNSALRLYNAPNWMDRVHIFNRDCSQFADGAKEKVNLPTTENIIRMASSGYDILDTSISSINRMVPGTEVVTVRSNDWAGSSVHYTPPSLQATCVHNQLVTSIIPKAMLQQSTGDYGNGFFGSTLASGQPFVYAGDTVLTAECESIDPGAPLESPDCVVRVHRIYGSEYNHYTLVETNARLPAWNVPQTPARIPTSFSSHLTIPYSYTTNPWTHNPATASEDAVFYAVNPYWQVFTAFMRYCNDPNSEGALQLSVTSSFAAITVHRVYTYKYCSPAENQDGCYGDGMAAGIRIATSTRPEFQLEDCYKPMDIAVSSLEYIDVENVAVNIIRARLADTDPLTLVPKNFTTVTYFLNTITMQIRKDRAWNSLVAQSVVQTQGRLCPAMRRMPNFGSLLTEIGVAGTLLLRMPFNLLLNGVYIFQGWSSSEKVLICPLVTRGHSALLNACGGNALSLKEFFASMTKLNEILFSTIAVVAGNMVGFPGSGNVRTFLNGIRMYGLYQYNPMVSAVVGGRILGTFSDTPLDNSAVSILTTTLRLPNYMQAFKLGVPKMAMANFVYHFTVELIYRIVRASKSGGNAETVFWATMYDFKKEMDAIVTKPLLQSCAGLSLIFGYTNPWAQFARFQCNAMSMVLSNVVEFLNVFMVSLHFLFYSNYVIKWLVSQSIILNKAHKIVHPRLSSFLGQMLKQSIQLVHLPTDVLHPAVHQPPCNHDLKHIWKRLLHHPPLEKCCQQHCLECILGWK